MDDTPSILTDYYRRMTAWICRHVPPAQSGVSHTKVQVLSSTHCAPPRADVTCPSPFKLCETWASRLRSNRRSRNRPEDENRAQDAKLVNEIAGKFSDRTRNKHGAADGDEPPTCCLCLPVLPLLRWRQHRRAKVAPFNPQSPSIKPATTSPSSGEDTPVQPLTTEMSVFDLEGRDGQESPSLGLPTRQMMKEDTEKSRQRRRSEILFGHEKDDVEGISRESLSLEPRLKRRESDNNDQSSERREDTETKEHEIVGSETSRNLDKCDSEEVLYSWTNPDVKDNDVDVNGNRSCISLARSDEVTTDNSDSKLRDSLSRMTSLKELLPRPKTSRGLRPENGQEDPFSVIERSVEEVTGALFREEDGVKDFIRDDSVLTQCFESDSSKDDECDTGEESGESSPSRHEEVPHPTHENQTEELVTPKSSEHSGDADGVGMTSEEELQYERQQREQWRLAAFGEWATICQDYDEDEYLTECYLRMDEFQKEQAIMREWKATSERYHSIGVIQDLQNIQTLCKCTINQSERALRQFARVCRGPVPLSKSGQTKTEAIASLSRMVQKQTRRISENISNTFMEFYQIFEELDVLRERQDRVEEFLVNDLMKRDAEVEFSQSSSRSSVITPRLVSSRLQQREIDQDLADRYTEGYKVRSTDLFEVMPTIYEDEVFPLEECQELEPDAGFPVYNGMDDVSFDEADVRENRTAEDESSSDSNFAKSAGDEEERSVDGDTQLKDA